MDTLQFKIDIVGTSEEVKELGRLDQEIQKINAEIKAYRDLIKGGAKDSANYGAEVAKLQLQTKALKDEKKALEKQVTAEITAFKGAEGSMVRLNQELGLNRDKYRALSQAERENAEIGGKLLTVINRQDAELKQLDATMGNHQRNVGNYSSVWQSAQGIMLKATAIVGTLWGGIKAGETIIKSAQATGDEWEKTISGVEFGLNALYKTIATGDYSNFLDNIRLAINAGIEYAQVLDDLADRQRSYAIREAETRVEIEKLEAISKNEMLTEQERIAAAQRANELEMQLAQDKQENANRLFEAEKNNLVALSGLTEEQLLNFVKQYDRTEDLRKKAEEYNATLEEMKKQTASFGNAKAGLTTVAGGFDVMANYVANTNEEVKIYAQLLNKVGKTTDEELDQFTKSWAGVYEVQSGVLQATEKGVTRISTLQKRMATEDEGNQNKAAAAREKAAKETESIVKRLADIAVKNQDDILKLSSQYIDAEISLMAEGVEKKNAVEQKRYDDLKASLLKENEARITAIDEQVKIVEDRGSKATDAEIDHVKKLKAERESLIKSTNGLIEIEEKVHQDKLGQILRTATDKDLKVYLSSLDKKSEAFAKAQAEIERRGRETDTEAVKKYDKEVALAEAEGQAKIEEVQKYYTAKGRLTGEQEQAQAKEIKQIQLDVFQNQYKLLKAELEARKAAGAISEEDLLKQQQLIAELYLKIRGFKDELVGEKDKKGSIGEQIIDALFGGLQETLDISNDKWQSWKNDMLAAASELVNALQNAFVEAQQQRIQQELKAEKSKLDAQKKNELKALEDRRKRGLITEEKYNEQKEALDEKYAQKAEEAERKAFERQKKLSIALVWVNAALAVIKSIAEYGFILGGILGILILATAAVQTDTINKQKYALGGMVRGRSHAQGGETFPVGGGLVELEGGEGVLKKSAMDSARIYSVTGTPRQITSDLNYLHGGVRFGQGGYVPSPTPAGTQSIRVDNQIDTDYFALKVAQALNDKKVFLSMIELNESQRGLQQIEAERVW